MEVKRQLNQHMSQRLAMSYIVVSWTLFVKHLRLISSVALVAEWLRVRLRVRMVKGSTLTVGSFLSLENLNVIIRAIN